MCGLPRSFRSRCGAALTGGLSNGRRGFWWRSRGRGRFARRLGWWGWRARPPIGCAGRVVAKALQRRGMRCWGGFRRTNERSQSKSGWRARSGPWSSRSCGGVSWPDSTQKPTIPRFWGIWRGWRAAVIQAATSPEGHKVSTRVSRQPRPITITITGRLRDRPDRTRTSVLFQAYMAADPKGGIRR